VCRRAGARRGPGKRLPAKSGSGVGVACTAEFSSSYTAAPRTSRHATATEAGGAATARHARPVVAWSWTRARGSRDGGHRWRRGNRTRSGRSRASATRLESREPRGRDTSPRSPRGPAAAASNNKLNIANSYDNTATNGSGYVPIAQSQTRYCFAAARFCITEAEPALFRFESAAGTATPGAPREQKRTPLPFSERRGAHRNYKQRKPVM
jgi:hypothetical protein